MAEAIEMSFRLWTRGPKEALLDESRSPMGKGNLEVENGGLLSSTETLGLSCAKRDVPSGGPKEACVRWGWYQLANTI